MKKNNLYKTNNWKALQEVRKQKDDIDDAIAGYCLVILCFMFIVGVIYLILK